MKIIKYTEDALIIFKLYIYMLCMCVYIFTLMTDMIVAFEDESVEHYKRISWVLQVKLLPHIQKHQYMIVLCVL